MSSSSLLLSLVLLLASSAGLLPAVARADAGERGLTHIHFYMLETLSGPNATFLTVVPSPLGGDALSGTVGVLDIPLLDGPDPKNSTLIGRYQALYAFAGLVTPPGLVGTGNLVFTAGEHNGSTVALVGTSQSLSDATERAVVGGTAGFRLARGYSVMTVIAKPTPETNLYEVDLFLEKHA